jgi:predicted glycogen debranching enzyme
MHIAFDILKQFGRFEKNGTIPNMIHGTDAGNRDTSDAPLWFIVACADLVKTNPNQNILEETIGEKTIKETVASIVHAYASGTPNGIQMDPESGLIYSPAHFTWMDTDFPAGTPRQGYPIEIQALWHASLRWMAEIDGKEKTNWLKLADRVQASIGHLFYKKENGYLSDCLHTETPAPANHGKPDDALRPNQLLAITLKLVDKSISEGILSSCQELLVPGGLRSLADRPVECPLAISLHGESLNNPFHPYLGQYAGDEDTRRKPAYHNGTAWTWLLPVFCEAWGLVYGAKGLDTALSWLSGSVDLVKAGCIGHIPEILDGDFPHTQRGCDAQAWGASEWTRVWHWLMKEKQAN